MASGINSPVPVSGRVDHQMVTTNSFVPVIGSEDNEMASGNNSLVPVIVSEDNEVESGNNYLVPVIGSEDNEIASGNNSLVPVIGSKDNEMESGNNSMVSVIGSEDNEVGSGNNSLVPVIGSEDSEMASGNNSLVPVIGSEDNEMASGNNSLVPVIGSEDNEVESGNNSLVPVIVSEDNEMVSGNNSLVHIIGSEDNEMASGNNSPFMIIGREDHQNLSSSTSLLPATRKRDSQMANLDQQSTAESHLKKTYNMNAETVNISSGRSLPGTLACETLKLRIFEAKKTFIATKSFKHLQKTLDENGHVTVCGASGEGKTTMALMLAREYMKKGYDVVFVEKVDAFDFNECISSTYRCVLILDDVFGTVGFITDTSHLKTLINSLRTHIQSYKNESDKSQSLQKSGNGTQHQRSKDQDMITGDKKRIGISQEKNVKDKKNKDLKVVFTSKTYNFKEGISKLQHQRQSMFTGHTVVDLTANKDYRYSDDEKLDMFEKFKIMNPTVKTEETSKQEILDIDPELFGFPLTCQLYFEFVTVRKGVKDFFQRPLYYLRIELNDILSQKNNRSAALILMLLCEDKLDLAWLELPGTDQTMDETVKHVTDILPSTNRLGIATAIRHFAGTFLSRGDIVTFAHSSIYDACACVMYNIYPGFVLRYCSLDFLYERVKAQPTEEAKVTDNLHFLLVSLSYYPLIVTRLVDAMKQGHFAKTVTHHLLTNKHFVELIVQELRSAVNVDTNWIKLKDKGKGFLFWAVNGHSTKLVQELENILDIRFTQSDVSEAIDGCVGKNNLILLKFLLTKLETENRPSTLNRVLLLSGETGTSELVEYLLGRGACINASDENMQNYIHLTCKFGRSKILGSLISHIGPLVNRKDYLSAVHSVDIKGRTPVMLAAMCGSCECFSLLCTESKMEGHDCDENNLLHLAVAGGNKNVVQQLIMPSNINCRGQYGFTPVMRAAYDGHQSVFDFLMSNNADLTVQDDDGDSLLHVACMGGNSNIVQSELTPYNIDCGGQYGWTPVMIAALNAHQRVFTFLVSNNADLTLVCDDGNNVLHLACQGGNADIVRSASLPADINCRGQYDWTPVMIAAVYAHKTVFDLLVCNADLSSVDINGNSTLHLACQGGNRDIVQRLLTPTDINNRGRYGRTPVMIAAVTGHQSVFDLLVLNNADLTLTDKGGDSLLHLACQGGNREIVERVLTPFNINSRGKYGRTPLMKAVVFGQQSVFDFLMFSHTDPTLTDEGGDSVLHLASWGGHREIVERVLTPFNINNRGKHGRTPVMTAAVTGHQHVFDFLVSNQADLTLNDKGGNNLLHLSCRGGNRDIVERVLTSSNINSRGKYGWTPLMKASVAGDESMFDLLVSKHADLTLIEKGGDSLLHLACKGGTRKIVSYVLTPSNINNRGRYGRTPVMTAAVSGHQSVFDLLVSNHADLTLTDESGDSLLHLACQGGNREIVESVLTPFNLNSRGKYGRTPLMKAVVFGQQSVFDFLMFSHTDPTLTDEGGDSVLHLASRGGHREIVERVLTPFNINNRGKHGRTPVMTAAVTGYQHVFDFLVSKQADLQLNDEDGDSLLHLSCCGGNRDIVERVLTPSNINSRGEYGWTPLMKAAVDGDESTFDFLVSKHADLTLIDKGGDSLLHLACKGGTREIVSHVLTPSNINNRGRYGRTPVMTAAVSGHQSVFDFLVSNHANLTLTDGGGDNLLHLACQGGNREIVERVLTPFNINSRGKYGRTPLMKTAVFAQLSIFDFLMFRHTDLTLTDEAGDSLLHLACQGGNREIVERVLTPSNINNRGKYGRTPVMTAAVSGHQCMFDFLVSNHADLTLTDGGGDSLLHLACQGGNREIVERVLTPFNLNSRGKYGRTPLMKTAVFAQQSLFDFLMFSHTDLTLTDEAGDSLLHLACQGGNREIVERVLIPCNINNRGKNGHTPVMTAAVFGRRSVFDFLVTNHADLTLTNEGGNSLLHLACQGGNREIVECVLTPSNINNRGMYGRTPLMQATVFGRQSVFDFLVTNHADLTLTNEGGDSLLHLACQGGSREIVEYLLTPSNINNRGRYGRTPVMTAAVTGRQSVFDLLVSNHADLTLTDEGGNSLLHLACQGGNREIVERVLTPSNKNSRGMYGYTPLMKAAVFGRRSVFDFLFSNHDVTLTNEDGNSLLHLACQGGNKKIVERVLTPSNINKREKYGNTPLMKAAIFGRRSVFDFLVTNHADLTLTNEGGDSLLHLACQGGNKEIVKRVLTPLNINKREKYGNTPLMKAAVFGRRSVFDFLVTNHADLTLTNEAGDSLLHLACQGGNKEIVERVLTPSNINNIGVGGWTPVMKAAYAGHKHIIDLLVEQNAKLSDDIVCSAHCGGKSDLADYLETLLD